MARRANRAASNPAPDGRLHFRSAPQGLAFETAFNMSRDLPAREPPSLATVQRVLRETTEFLAHELSRPHAAAPDWSEVEWRIARAAVTIHGVSGLMAGRTRWHGTAGLASSF